MLENAKLTEHLGEAGSIDLKSKVPLKIPISSQPQGQRSTVARLMNEFVSIAVQAVINSV